MAFLSISFEAPKRKALSIDLHDVLLGRILT